MKEFPWYPKIWSESSTLIECSHRSIARFGDGEWRCAIGGACTSQRAERGLAQELQEVLKKPGDCLVGLPNPFAIEGAPRRESWLKYTGPQFSSLLGAKTYASSFITRPDNAPWIDTPAYWNEVRELWRDQDIVLVSGDKKSITTEMIGSEAKSVREVIGPRQHAYAVIDQLEEQIGKTSARVLLCLGTCATVLAYRLSKKGIHALDLGHIGMFMRHAGAYRYGADDLTSSVYRDQLVELHRKQKWGADGAKHTDAVRALHAQYQPKTVLDYGCGENKLADSLAAEFRISGYDPGIIGREKMPKPCDMVVCTDVLEHVEPEKLDAVLDHVHRLTGRVAYFVIDTKPANAILPDGRNAHLSLHDAHWWERKLNAIGWSITQLTNGSKSVTIVALK
jgi:hypothetical protein